MADFGSVWEQLTSGNQAVAFLVCFFVIIPAGLVTALLAVVIIFRKLDDGKSAPFPEMRKISRYIQAGARTYLKRQAKTLVLLVIVLFVPVGLTGHGFLPDPVLATLVTGAIYVVGALSSLLAGYVSMQAATRANILVIEAASENPQSGFKKGYFGGMIGGILNISLFVLGIWLLFLVTQGQIRLMTGYGFGASTASLLAQVGGGIFTKSADIGADLVGKFESGIEEDDPRNPAIIADAVGDNVGDCAGRG
ncbi:MAG: sodium/proton-translocating pyrophosphatase, partial [Candidatus Lokiarchaeota archaeon]|nr:sodium/proton-translocating pyrophosphatase [Candidatus Lokiarchaeota archaeon]